MIPSHYDRAPMRAHPSSSPCGKTASDAAAGLRRADTPTRRAFALAESWRGLPQGVTRWRLAAALRAAARPLGLNGGMLRLMEHYIDLSYDQDWAPDSEPIIARPLSEITDAMGLGERQIRNIERALVERGLLAFRDSGNHHRKGRRDRHTGRLVYAYGPSLAPAGARADEIIALADATRRRIAECRRLRIALSALRRRIRAELAAAETSGVDVTDLAAQFHAAPARTPTGASPETLELHRDVFVRIADAISARLENARSIVVEHGDTSGKPEASARHETDTSKNHAINGVSTALNKAKRDASRGMADDPPGVRRDHGLGATPIALAMAAAGPEITAALNRTDATGWRGLVEAAAEVAPLLGIDRGLWGEACNRLGRNGAALALMIIERGVSRGPLDGAAPVRKPDAYLRAMLDRAESGGLHLDRSVRALARRTAPSTCV
jgi:replication initiation protein RepC